MSISNNFSLIDTNVLVYAADEMSPFHQASKTLRDKSLKGEISLCISPQVLNEFFATVTNPKRVGNPRTREDALLEIEKYFRLEAILKIYPGPQTIETTLSLLKQYDIKRQQIFDLYLVATMLSNNVTRIYTFNQADFCKFKEIEVLEP